MNNLRTAAEYRSAAASARKAEAESWERSDTDGFLSQWGNREMAKRYDHLASIAENGGMMQTLALFLDGEFASADQRSGQFGLYWILNDAAAEKHGKRFFNPSKAKNATERDKARGFTFGYVSVAAYESTRTGGAEIDTDAIKRGEFTVVATDGAYDGIDEMMSA